MREYIDARVASGHYGNTSEYIRDLIRKDQRAQIQGLTGMALWYRNEPNSPAVEPLQY